MYWLYLIVDRNRLKDFKKTYVKLNEEVDTNFQKFEKI
jgi:hypothetical protein